MQCFRELKVQTPFIIYNIPPPLNFQLLAHQFLGMIYNLYSLVLYYLDVMSLEQGSISSEKFNCSSLNIRELHLRRDGYGREGGFDMKLLFNVVNLLPNLEVLDIVWDITRTSEGDSITSEIDFEPCLWSLKLILNDRYPMFETWVQQRNFASNFTDELFNNVMLHSMQSLQSITLAFKIDIDDCWDGAFRILSSIPSTIQSLVLHLGGTVEESGWDESRRKLRYPPLQMAERAMIKALPVAASRWEELGGALERFKKLKTLRILHRFVDETPIEYRRQAAILLIVKSSFSVAYLI
ncbi:hypothetical protein ABKN59_010970 [Abortiporus biennis]